MSSGQCTEPKGWVTPGSKNAKAKVPPLFSVLRFTGKPSRFSGVDGGTSGDEQKYRDHLVLGRTGGRELLPVGLAAIFRGLELQSGSRNLHCLGC